MTNKYSVGRPYNPNRVSWPECVQYNYRGGEHELALFWLAPSAQDIAAVRRGEVELAPLYARPVLYMLYRIEGACGWSDAPYSIHLVPAGERVSPPPESRRTLLHVILVDAGSGIVRALRALSMSPELAAAIYAGVRDQLTAPWDRVAYDAAIARAYTQTADEMVRGASIRESLGVV